MTTQAIPENVEKAIQMMVEDKDIQDIVKDIEGSVMTTKGHYGRYMAAMTPFAQDKASLFVVYMAMLRLGANREGLLWAIKLIRGNY